MEGSVYCFLFYTKFYVCLREGTDKSSSSSCVVWVQSTKVRLSTSYHASYAAAAFLALEVFPDAPADAIVSVSGTFSFSSSDSGCDVSVAVAVACSGGCKRGACCAWCFPWCLCSISSSARPVCSHRINNSHRINSCHRINSSSGRKTANKPR